MRKVTEAECGQIVALYVGGQTIRQISCKMRRCYLTIRKILFSHGVLRVTKKGQPTHTPTPEEIARETREIRRRWSEADHCERSGGSRNSRWTPPVISTQCIKGVQFMRSK